MHDILGVPQRQEPWLLLDCLNHWHLQSTLGLFTQLELCLSVEVTVSINSFVSCSVSSSKTQSMLPGSRAWATCLKEWVNFLKVCRNTALKCVCCGRWSAALTGSHGRRLCEEFFGRRRTRIGISSSCKRDKKSHHCLPFTVWWLHMW